MKDDKNKKIKYFHLKVPHEIHKKTKLTAVSQNMSMQQYVLDALVNQLKNDTTKI